MALRPQGRSAKAKHEANDPLSLLNRAVENKQSNEPAVAREGLCLSLALRPKAKHEANDPLSSLNRAGENKQSNEPPVAREGFTLPKK